MVALFLQYVLPFLAIILLVFVVALRIHLRGGPALLFLVFFLLAFGPSLAYALIADDSSSALFNISILSALIVTGVLGVKMYRKK